MSEVPRIFDPAALRARRRRAAACGARPFLLEHLAADLAERLGAVLRDFPVALDLGSPGDAVAAALAGAPRVGRVIRLEADPDALGGAGAAVAAHPDLLPFRAGSLDLVVSVLALSAVDDLPGALAQIRRALKPDGLFLAALLGGESLTELRQAFAAAEAAVEGGISPRVAPFVDVRDLGALLQRAEFALPVVDVDRLTVRYAGPIELMRDLREQGLANPLAERRRSPLRRATLAAAVQTYAERFSDPDGRVRATFDVVWAAGWAPHPDQQKPLRPGSARMRLAAALGTTETRLGRDGG